MWLVDDAVAEAGLNGEYSETWTQRGELTWKIDTSKYI